MNEGWSVTDIMILDIGDILYPILGQRYHVLRSNYGHPEGKGSLGLAPDHQRLMTLDSSPCHSIGRESSWSRIRSADNRKWTGCLVNTIGSISHAGTSFLVDFLRWIACCRVSR